MSHVRQATIDLMTLVEDGMLNPVDVLRDALNWMSASEVEDFAGANGYLEEEEEEEG